MWFIGVEVVQETTAPPPKKMLDPPLKLASYFELGGSSLSLGTLSTPISKFKLTGFKTVSVSYKFRGKVPTLFMCYLVLHFVVV